MSLEREGMNKEEDIRKVRSQKEELHNLQKMAVTVEKDIAVPVKAEADKSKENLQKFEERLKEYSLKMKKEDVY